MKTLLIFCAIVLCSISCISHKFTVNVDRIYIDEETDIPMLMTKEGSIRIHSDVPVYDVYHMLDEKEEIVLLYKPRGVYFNYKDNLK